MARFTSLIAMAALLAIFALSSPALASVDGPSLGASVLDQDTMPGLMTASDQIDPVQSPTDSHPMAVYAVSLLLLLGVVHAPSMPKEEKKTTKSKSRTKERSSEDFPLPQPGSLVMPGLGETLSKQGDIVRPTHEDMEKDRLEALAFAESLVTIMIHPPSEEKGSPTTDLVAVNGKWAEVVFDGKLVPWGYLPRGHKITTRRMYVEELAKARHTSVTTEVKDRNSERPKNLVHRSTRLKYPFQVYNDHHPKAEAWLTRILG